MHDLLVRPWPWYIAGPLLGLFAPLLLWLGNRVFGVSANLRHLCAAVLPGKTAYTSYNWRAAGGWNLAFAAGIVIGGVLAGVVFRNPEPVAIAPSTHAALAALGIGDFSGLVPRELFSFASLATLRGFSLVVGGGFLVGFGTAYAGGCTSGHGISGVANLEIPSFIALGGFFAGGLIGTFALIPLILGGFR